MDEWMNRFANGMIGMKTLRKIEIREWERGFCDTRSGRAGRSRVKELFNREPLNCELKNLCSYPILMDCVLFKGATII